MVIDISKLHTLALGKAGEYNSRPYDFDCTCMLNEFGEGTASIVYFQPGVPDPHPVMATFNSPYISWTPTYEDLKNAGRGCIEINWFINGGLAKTKTINIVIANSLSTAPAPEESGGWIDTISRLYAQTVDLANQLQTLIESNQEVAEDVKVALETTIPEALDEIVRVTGAAVESIDALKESTISDVTDIKNEAIDSITELKKRSSRRY